MRTKTRQDDLAGRRAFVWEEPPAPPLADLAAGSEGRRRFARYWIRDTLRDLSVLLSHHALRPLPAAVASALGAFSFAQSGRFYPGRSRRMRANTARLRPDLDADAVVRAGWANRGRLMSEFSVLPRLDTPETLVVEGADHLLEARRRGPVIVLAMHLGNWELLLPVFRRLAVPVATFYMPPESRAEHRIACRVREDFGGTLLPPGVKGVRPALKRLARPDGVVVIFGDEGWDGRIMAPFFGRPTHLAGNLAIAVRLARHSGATIVPTYVTRSSGTRFTCRWLEPIVLPPVVDAGAALPADVERLNAVIEPIVRRHLDQWFFLDHRL